MAKTTAGKRASTHPLSWAVNDGGDGASGLSLASFRAGNWIEVAIAPGAPPNMLAFDVRIGDRIERVICRLGSEVEVRSTVRRGHELS